jgi:hypothetical protein
VTLIAVSPTFTPQPQEPPHIEAAPLPAAQSSTEALLLEAVLPERDQRELAIRLKNNGQDIPLTVAGPPPAYQPGAEETFWITDNQSEPPQQFQKTATLQYITDHSYWWVENSFDFDRNDLQRSADRFETETYPINREFFGSEWSPGVDNDVHVHVFMGNVPGVAGYFSASNSYTQPAEPYSNQREMFFINLYALSPGNDEFDGVLAHEFQHMIHWHQDRNEDTWVNEGMSELATFLNHLGPSNFVGAFTQAPDTQLNSWTDSPGGSLANYGASFLFMAYFLQRYGEDMTKALVAAPENGLEGIDKVLADHGHNERFADIFADFLIANYVQDPTAGSGQWGYLDMSPAPVNLTYRYSRYPIDQLETVYQFGGDYLELTGQGNLTIKFSGDTTVPVINTQAPSGQYQWYSHRGDDTNTRLTRTVDLTGVDAATLNYWTWYDIEDSWDYGYVEVSTDGGQVWTILQTPRSATENPSGNAYGPGYTGKSGNGGPDWIEESLDLSPYAGQKIQIRFEYVTDDAVNRPGWSLDDISIPEIGFFDNAETPDPAWVAEGFVRMDNILPQKFVVQLLEFGDTITLRPFPLDAANTGAMTVTGLGSRIDRAVLVVSGLTPVTTQPAGYQYQLQPSP